MGGHGDDQAAAGPQDANHLLHRSRIGLYVLQHIRGDDHIKGGGTEG
jgi:hypothetical protein